MSGWIVLIIVIVIVAIVVGGTLLSRGGRRRGLREKFGPEYDRVVAEHQSRRLGEAELSRREHRIQKLSLRELTDEEWERYTAQWDRVQERFVETPAEAVAEAQSLVETVMRERGYPVTNYEQTVADLSVKRARVLDRYRSAHAISERADSGQFSTEDLRTAMLYYRELFDQLLAVERTTEPAAPEGAAAPEDEPEDAAQSEDAVDERQSGANAAR